VQQQPAAQDAPLRPGYGVVSNARSSRSLLRPTTSSMAAQTSGAGCRPFPRGRNGKQRNVAVTLGTAPTSVGRRWGLTPTQDAV